MKKARMRIILVLLATILIASSCDLDPGVLVLTREAEVSDEFSGWDSRPYFTGQALVETGEEPAVGNYVYLQLNIPLPGTYYPWVLTGLTGNAPGQTRNLKISVTPYRANSLTRMDSVEIVSGPSRALRWVSSEGPDRGLEFSEMGEYFLIVEGIKDSTEARLVFDKLILTNAPNYRPSGYEVVPDTVQTALPPAWAFGVIYGGNTAQDETLATVDSLLALGLPVDAYWLDSWYWDFGGQGKGPEGYMDFRGDPDAYPEPYAVFQSLEERGIASGLWIWDAVHATGNEDLFQEFLEADAFTGPPEMVYGGPHNNADSTLTGFVDFEMEPSATFWKSKMAPFFENGLDFLRLEGNVTDYFIETAFSETRRTVGGQPGRGFLLAPLRTAWMPRVKRHPTIMIEPVSPSWSQPGFPLEEGGPIGGLEEQVRMLADPSMPTFEIPFLAHALAGSGPAGSANVEEDLYLRWIPFALMAPVSAFFSPAGDPILNYPFLYSPRTLEVFRYYAEWKLKLFPYLYSYAQRAAQNGLKPVQGTGHPDQYLLGRELLVAPITDPGARSREIHLPEGEWLDFYTAEPLPDVGSFTYSAPPEKLPLLVRAGSILPSRPYRQSVGRGSNDSLELLVFPGNVESGAFELWEDDGVSMAYTMGETGRTRFSFRRQGQSLSLVAGMTEGEYAGKPRERNITWTIHLDQAPRRVERDGEELPSERWNFDAENGILRILSGDYLVGERSLTEVRY